MRGICALCETFKEGEDTEGDGKVALISVGVVQLFELCGPLSDKLVAGVTKKIEGLVGEAVGEDVVEGGGGNGVVVRSTVGDVVDGFRRAERKLFLAEIVASCLPKFRPI